MAGYKTWAVGEEVLAADLNGFIQSQVVPRFPNAAARTAQLPAPVVNQLSMLDTVDMVQRWNGTTWVNLAPYSQAAVATVTTDAAGVATVPYLTAFASNAVCVAIAGDNNARFWCVLLAGGQTTTGSAMVLHTGPGAVVVSTAVKISWIAFGARP